MNSKISWDDLRLILAIFDAGSLSGAGRALGSSHATVFRKLNAIEQKLGVSLFQRHRSGYTPTVVGEQLAAAAHNIDAQVNDLERSIIGQDLKPSGTVRLTTLDSLLFGLLSPLLVSFQRDYPRISLEVSISNHLYDLSRREADVAIRPTSQPNEALFGRKVATLEFAVYGAKHLLPEDAKQVQFEKCNWIGADEAMIYPELMSWMSRRGLMQLSTYKVDSVLGMFAAACAGQGLCVLPRYLGDPSAELVRVSDNIPEIETELWMVTHNDLRKTTRVRVLMEALGKAIGERAMRQSGP